MVTLKRAIVFISAKEKDNEEIVNITEWTRTAD